MLFSDVFVVSGPWEFDYHALKPLRYLPACWVLAALVAPVVPVVLAVVVQVVLLPDRVLPLVVLALPCEAKDIIKTLTCKVNPQVVIYVFIELLLRFTTVYYFLLLFAHFHIFVNVFECV